MRADPKPARARASRRTTVRALIVSLGLHAAAAAAYGGYQVGGLADSPPSLDLGGGTFIAISIRGEPGGSAPGGPVAASPADVIASFDAVVPPVVFPPDVAELPPPMLMPPEPEPTPEPPPEPARPVPPPAVIAVVDEGGIATLADRVPELSLDVVEVVAASLQGYRQRRAAPAPAPAPAPSMAQAAGPPGGGGGQGAGGRDSGSAPGDGEGGGGGLGIGRNPPPEYPEAARMAGQEGVVWILALCDTTGAVQDAWVEESSGFPLLDEAALAAVRKWTFVPAIEGGVAVAGYVRRPISFKLAR